MTVVVLGIDRGEFEVRVPGERIEGGGYAQFKYTVKIPPGVEAQDSQLPFVGATCDCQKPQLTGIACSHLVAACSEAKYNVDDFVDTRYNIQNLVMTWSGQFHSYGDEDRWPVTNEPKLIPDRELINRGRRRHIRRAMTMDEMEGRKKGKKQSKKKGSKKSTTDVRPTPPPLPMEALQSGRHTSMPPPRDEGLSSTSTVQPGRLSLNVDPRHTTSRASEVVQPRRNSISADPRNIATAPSGIRAESARFSTRDANLAHSTSRRRDESIATRIRKFFTKGKKKK